MRSLTVDEAARIIKKGGIVAYPTETFYGLAVLPSKPKAVEKIFKIKRRERGKPVSLILSSGRHLAKWAKKTTARHRQLIRRFWPGPLTLVFGAQPSVSDLLTGKTGTIGLRVSSHPVARRLARLSGGAITATSANLSKLPPAVSFLDVRRQLGGLIDGVVAGRVKKKSKGSTILAVDKDGFRVLREGEISCRTLQKFFR